MLSQLHVESLKSTVSTFSLQDIAISVVFTLCLFAGAVANAAYASDNSDTYDNGCDVNDDDRSNDAQDACDNLATVRDAEGATAVSLCVCCTYITIRIMLGEHST